MQDNDSLSFRQNIGTIIKKGFLAAKPYLVKGTRFTGKALLYTIDSALHPVRTFKKARNFWKRRNTLEKAALIGTMMVLSHFGLLHLNKKEHETKIRKLLEFEVNIANEQNLSLKTIYDEGRAAYHITEKLKETKDFTPYQMDSVYHNDEFVNKELSKREKDSVALVQYAAGAIVYRSRDKYNREKSEMAIKDFAKLAANYSWVDPYINEKGAIIIEMSPRGSVFASGKQAFESTVNCFKTAGQLIFSKNINKEKYEDVPISSPAPQ